MAKLVTLEEQDSDRQLPTVVILATSWWETAIVHVKLQETGLGVKLPVRVCCTKLKCYVVDALRTLSTKINHFCAFKTRQQYIHTTHTHITYVPENLVHTQKACTNLKAHDSQVKLNTQLCYFILAK